MDKPLECDCGRTHYAPIKAVSVGAGALLELPAYVRKYGFAHPYLVCDSITFDIAGERCLALLAQAGIDAKAHVLTHLGFDEATLGELVINMQTDCDLVVAVGTGSISDMVRYFTFKLSLPCFTVATAAPMDGFAASIGVMNINNLKTTLQAHNAMVIIGDTDILKNAPYPMIAAGLGDLLGKLTCLCDWELSHIITGEHYCENIAGLMNASVRSVLSFADRVKDRDAGVTGKIMEGLVMSGMAISLYGSSRPASGCEHHMSHYWEMLFEQRNIPRVMHGTQVGIGTVLVLKLAELFRGMTPDYAAARAAASAYDPEAWTREIRCAYGPAAEGVIALEHTADKNGTAGRLRRIDAIEKNMSGIRAVLEALPSSEQLAELLKSLNSPYLPAQIGIDDDLLRDTFLYCKEVRARYTFLQMLWDLGMLEPLSDLVIAELKEENHPAGK